MQPRHQPDQPYKRVLVTGAAGQLGRYLKPALTHAGYDVVGMGRQQAEGVDIVADICAQSALTRAVNQTEPDIIIHAAAYTDVDGSESNPDLAARINVDGSANVARVAHNMGIWMIGLSTDFVFAGIEGAPYAEDATPNPVSIYGSTKLAGENAILEANPDFAIARTAWLYGGAGKHFPRTVLNRLVQSGKMDVVDDEIGSPTYAGDLAEALVALLSHKPPGVLHLINAGATSRYGLAQEVAMVAGLDPAMVSPVSTQSFLKKYPLPARRPTNSTLLNVRAAALGVTLPAWDDAVGRYVPSLAIELKSSARARSGKAR